MAQRWHFPYVDSTKETLHDPSDAVSAILTFTVLAVLCELVVVSAATLIVCHRQLDALLLTASIADSARVHSWGERKEIAPLFKRVFCLGSRPFSFSLYAEPDEEAKINVSWCLTMFCSASGFGFTLVALLFVIQAEFSLSFLALLK